jgi:hypothetical protein
VAGEVLIIQVVIWAYLIPNSFLSVVVVVVVGELAAYTKNLVPAGPRRVTPHVSSPPLAYLLTEWGRFAFLHSNIQGAPAMWGSRAGWYSGGGPMLYPTPRNPRHVPPHSSEPSVQLRSPESVLVPPRNQK